MKKIIKFFVLILLAFGNITKAQDFDLSLYDFRWEGRSTAKFTLRLCIEKDKEKARYPSAGSGQESCRTDCEIVLEKGIRQIVLPVSSATADGTSQCRKVHFAHVY